MRVTQSYMLEMASTAASNAQSKVATASAEVTSGVRVNVPSDDLAGWEEGERASIRQSESTARGSALTLATSKMQASDSALTTISTALTTATSLANEMANGTLNASERQAAANQVQALHDTVLAAANTVGPDGKPVFSGSQTTTPFSSTNAFSGDSVEQTVEVSEGKSMTVGVSGSVLTAASGVDVLGTLSNLVTALNGNNVAGVQTSLADLQTATSQVQSAQAAVGSQESALNDASDARSSFELQLQTLQSSSVGDDTTTAATALAQAQNGLAASETVEQVLQELAQKNIS